jgi:hypothetical protein
MRLPAINLFDVVKKYLQKSIYAHSGEGIDPSIIQPTVVLNLPKEYRPRFGVLDYSGSAAQNPYVTADGTKYFVHNYTAQTQGTIVDGLDFDGSTGTGVRTITNEPGFYSASAEIFTIDPTKVKEVNMPGVVKVYRNPADGSQQQYDTFAFTYKVVFNLVEDTGPVADTEIDIPTSIISQVQNSYLGATNVVGTTVTATGYDSPNLFSHLDTGAQLRGSNPPGLWRAGTQSRTYQYLGIATTKDTTYPESPSEFYGDTTDKYTGILLTGRDNTIDIGVFRTGGTSTNTPIHVVDKATARAVYILGVNCEWKTITVDGTTIKVLAAKA